MPKTADVTFDGASGAKYQFAVYTLDTKFNNIGAVYGFTQRTIDAVAKEWHALLYIGETGDLADRIANHEKWLCVSQHGVNRICAHPDGDAQSWLQKEADLVKNNDTPCND
jgi:hypothetical protein